VFAVRVMVLCPRRVLMVFRSTPAVRRSVAVA
jgi:hypothetical protein